jgi:hypothetical protein
MLNNSLINKVFQSTEKSRNWLEALLGADGRSSGYFNIFKRGMKGVCRRCSTAAEAFPDRTV